MSFIRNIVRIGFELTAPLVPSLDKFTNAQPRMSVGREVEFQFAFLYTGALDNLASITSVKVEVKTITNGITDVASAPVMSHTIGTFNAGLTQAAWDAGTDQHCVTDFLYTETGLSVDASTNYKDYALIVTAQTSAGPVDIGTAILRCVSTGGLTVLVPPAIGDPNYVRTDDYIADQKGVIRLKNAASVGIILINDQGYGVNIYATPGTTTPKLEIDIVNPAV